MVAELIVGAWRFGLSLRIRPVVMVGFFPCYCVHIIAFRAGRELGRLEIDLPEQALARFKLALHRLTVNEVLVRVRRVPASVDRFSIFRSQIVLQVASSFDPVHGF